jgi:hypothetical protein
MEGIRRKEKISEPERLARLDRRLCEEGRILIVREGERHQPDDYQRQCAEDDQQQTCALRKSDRLRRAQLP